MRRALLFFVFVLSLPSPSAQAQVAGEWTGTFGLAGPAGPVTALAGSGDRLYVGGDFFYAGDEYARRLAAFDKVTGQWSAVGDVRGEAVFDNDYVYTLLEGDDGTVYLGGDFASVDSVAAANVARYDPGADEWEPLGEGVDGAVRAFAVGPEGDLYVGGGFRLPGIEGDVNFARWDGETWHPIGGINSGIGTLAFDGDVLYVGGVFDTAGGIETKNIARYDTATETWSGLGGGVDRTVLGRVGAVTVGEDGIYVGGAFSEAIQPDGSVLAVNNVARWDPETETWSALGDGTDSLLTALAFGPDGDLYAGGDGWEAVLRRWDGDVWVTVDAEDVGVDSQRPTSVLIADDERLYLGGTGYFFFEGENPQTFLYTYDPFEDTWGVLGNEATDGFSDDVLSLETAPGGITYAGGRFIFAGTARVGGVARWDGEAWAPLGRGVSLLRDGYQGGRVKSLLYSRSGDLWVGGGFDEVLQADGTVLPTVGVARWDGETWHALGGGLDNGSGEAFAETAEGTLWVGGRFQGVLQADGEPLETQNLARWDPSTARWEAPPAIDFVLVNALSVDAAGALWVGGFRIVDGTGEARARVARLDPVTEQWVVLREWGFTGGVLDLAVVGDPEAGGALYAAVNTEGVWRRQDGVWTNLGGPEEAFSLARNGDPEAGGVLYAGGVYPAVQQWDGTAWSTLGSGLVGYVSPPLAYALALGAAEGDKVALWVGGEFVGAGSAPASCLARWETENLGTASEGEGAAVSGLELVAYPNPSSGAVTLRYQLAAPGAVRLGVYDVLGREVAVLAESVQAAGEHELPLEATGLAAGVYVVRLEAGGETLTRRLTLVR